VETPTSDYYGGHRPGNNLFAESIVAVDLKTGQRKWHYQLVHHPLWNYDMPAPPMLADINVNGRPIKALAQLTKQAWVYVLNRETGEPVWPIEERPVPQSDVPGERSARTQPHVTKPPAYARNILRVPDDLIDFTPELRAKALEQIKRYRVADTPFNPPMLGDLRGMLGGRKNYQLIVLEEFNIALRDGFLGLEPLLGFIKKASVSRDIIVTGRGAPQELLDAADLITEMKEIRHPYKKGIKARKGIEF